MKRPKIVTILGARPQFIKAAVLTPILRSFAIEKIIHTGQHFDKNMSEMFFEELTLPEPDYYLGIQSTLHSEMTGKMLIEIEKILREEKPDLALVYGDTNSTLAGALAASKIPIPLAHVEAGVRSYNRFMPEEINRVITDQLSSFHFVTSERASVNLKKEGCQEEHIYHVGDVMFDLALKMSQQISLNQGIEKKKKDYFLVTLHRSENTDNAEKLKKLKKLIEKLSEIKAVIWIMHPRTKKFLNQNNIQIDNHGNCLEIIEPQSYKNMIQLLQNCDAVLTDSGGLQKEAFYFKKPCVTLRSETEWTELVDLGWNFVCGNEINEKTIEKILPFLETDFRGLSQPYVYGKGNAANEIGRILYEILSLRA